MKNLFLLAAVILCFSCKDKAAPLEDYYFLAAQPINDSELSEFPNRFLGMYQSSDSTFLNIQKNAILSESYTTFSISKTALDTLNDEYNFTGQKLINKKTKEFYDVSLKGDSLQLSMKDVDTIFRFSEKQKAKKVNGNLVLSTKDSIFWKSKWLMFKKDNLSLNLIYENKDLIRIDSLSKTKSISLASGKYLLKPTRREFVKMMELKKIGSETKYKKVKHPI